MLVLVTTLAEAAGELENSPSVHSLCMTLPAGSRKVSADQRKTRAVMCSKLERGGGKGSGCVAPLALSVELRGEICLMIVCMA